MMDEGDDAAGKPGGNAFRKGAIGQPVDQQGGIEGLRQDRPAGLRQIAPV